MRCVGKMRAKWNNFNRCISWFQLHQLTGCTDMLWHVACCKTQHLGTENMRIDLKKTITVFLKRQQLVNLYTHHFHFSLLIVIHYLCFVNKISGQNIVRANWNYDTSMGSICSPWNPFILQRISYIYIEHILNLLKNLVEFSLVWFGLVGLGLVWLVALQLQSAAVKTNYWAGIWLHVSCAFHSCTELAATAVFSKTPLYIVWQFMWCFANFNRKEKR